MEFTVSPQILKLLIQFVESAEHGGKPERKWRGFMYAFLMFAVAVVQIFFRWIPGCSR
jgi:hypothetical protein